MKSKPFYLQVPENNGRTVVILGLMIAVLGAVVPYFLIIAPFFIGYGLYRIKRSKSKEYKDLAAAIRYYETKNIEKSSEMLNAITSVGEVGVRVSILQALIKYERKEYSSYIDIIEGLPSKRIKLELDLELKLGECYMETEKYDKALEVYKYLLIINPKSSYINEKIELCNAQIGH